MVKGIKPFMHTTDDLPQKKELHKRSEGRDLQRGMKKQVTARATQSSKYLRSSELANHIDKTISKKTC